MTLSTCDFPVSSLSSRDDILEQIAIMCQQERTSYQKVNYFLQLQQQATMEEEDDHTMVDSICRQRMIQWCYEIVQFCSLQTTTVEIAINYLDRYLGSSSNSSLSKHESSNNIALYDRSIFQLVTMTCLYTAIKIHEPKAMDPVLVSSLSRGIYTPEQIVSMESILLQKCQYLLHPPTLSYYTHLLLEFILQTVSDSTTTASSKDNNTKRILSLLLQEDSIQDHLRNLIHRQTEIAILDDSYISVPASMIASSCLRNAFFILLSSSNPNTIGLLHYLDQILQTAMPRMDDNDSTIIRERLLQTFLESNHDSLQASNDTISMFVVRSQQQQQHADTPVETRLDVDENEVPYDDPNQCTKALDECQEPCDPSMISSSGSTNDCTTIHIATGGCHPHDTRLLQHSTHTTNHGPPDNPKGIIRRQSSPRGIIIV